MVRSNRATRNRFERIAHLLLATALIAPSASSERSAENLSVPDRAVEQLRALRGEEPPTKHEVEDLLVEGADECVDLCLELLLTEKIPALTEDAPQRLSIQQETILLGALERMPRELVRQAADRDLLGATDERARVVACRVYGRAGSASDVDLLFTLSCDEGAEDTTAALRAGFRDGLKHLVTQPDAAVAIERKWPTAPDALRESTLLALGDSRDARALPLLRDVITWSDEWALLAIAQVRLIGASLDTQLNASLADSLADRLDDSETRIREAACFALGELRDEDHVEELIGLLDGADAVVRGAAHKSLIRIAGTQLPPNTRVWRVWFERERAAVDEMLNKLTDRLLTGPPTPVLEQLRDSTRFALGRHELAAALLPALDHENEEVRLTACKALRQLGSPVAIDALVYALGDHADEVRRAALGALFTITGVEGLETPDEWRDYLDDRSELY
ncbi:MAG: HEAT repeat domain-containing protein [Planctomycetes bacterium]|nr:HEAT repeat domain-containing protein [Planctomycetota bacterium]MCB9905563.1 HEAT repeat domain-containing protein [Planctomycetota bacterium]